MTNKTENMRSLTETLKARQSVMMWVCWTATARDAIRRDEWLNS